MSQEKAEEYQRAGAAVLDEKDPGWWRADIENAIDLGELVMHDPRACVLGQRCPGERWPSIAGRLSGFGWLRDDHDDPRDERDAWTRAHGFEIAHGADYAELGDAWTADIEARRAAAAA
jgi:hypothetical protein